MQSTRRMELMVVETAINRSFDGNAFVPAAAVRDNQAAVNASNDAQQRRCSIFYIT